ncbi:4-amino-4-deoxychorismate lyase [Bacillus sp. AFS002410]|uniref:aminodeoxychorismate lyase n=1 Tax=Bacillus sp. AFS002410 TaxID=2033481 RepID=UPI000BF17489|nr:aminodeoxychorismate lyase [Bacillus sp. AFS002410]PEJ59853.1 4-amino-4-deoxychorismate lyase [Bacillus sp. AFS002410]
MKIYYNGEFLNDNEVKISPYDHGFLYGLGVFETFRIYNGHPFLLFDHLNRLRKSLTNLSIEWNQSDEEIQSVLSKLMDLNELKDAYIRLNVSAGAGEIGLYTGNYTNPNTIIFIKPMHESNIEEKEGVILNTPRNSPEGRERLKSHHYLNNIIGKKEIGNSPSIEGIFLNKDGYLSEGIVSNLFFIKQNKLYTPHVDTGILNGITRQFVIHWAKLKGVSVEEGYFTEQELNEADEIFISNSIQEIIPVTVIGERFYNVSESSIIRDLQKDYQSYRNSLFSMNEMERSELT